MPKMSTSFAGVGEGLVQVGDPRLHRRGLESVPHLHVFGERAPKAEPLPPLPRKPPLLLRDEPEAGRRRDYPYLVARLKLRGDPPCLLLVRGLEDRTRLLRPAPVLGGDRPQIPLGYSDLAQAAR